MMLEEGERPVKTVKASSITHLTDPSEKAFQAEILEVAKMLHRKVFFTWNSLHSPPGMTDLIVLLPGRVIWRELKVGKNKLTAVQEETHAMLRLAGQDVKTWTPSDWDQIIKELS